MILERVCVGPFQVNCYILALSPDSQAIVIDPGDECARIRRTLSKYRLTPEFIINTHGHIDHIGCDDELGIPVYLHEAEQAFLNNTSLNLSTFLTEPYTADLAVRSACDGQSIELDGITLEVLHTPGHTPGGICLLMRKPLDKVIFTGDTLFYHSVGRTDLPLADERLLVDSIKRKLMPLADDTVIYPGHGPISTIGQERRHNPFLINLDNY